MNTFNSVPDLPIQRYLRRLEFMDFDDDLGERTKNQKMCVGPGRIIVAAALLAAEDAPVLAGDVMEAATESGVMTYMLEPEMQKARNMLRNDLVPTLSAMRLSPEAARYVRLCMPRLETDGQGEDYLSITKRIIDVASQIELGGVPQVSPGEANPTELLPRFALVG